MSVVIVDDFKQYDFITDVCGTFTEAKDGALIFSEYAQKSSIDTIIFLILLSLIENMNFTEYEFDELLFLRHQSYQICQYQV